MLHRVVLLDNVTDWYSSHIFKNHITKLRDVSAFTDNVTEGHGIRWPIVKHEMKRFEIWNSNLWFFNVFKYAQTASLTVDLLALM